MKVLRPLSTSVPPVPCLLMPKVPLITPPMVRVPEMSWVALAAIDTLPVPKLRPLPPVRKLPAQTELLFGNVMELPLSLRRMGLLALPMVREPVPMALALFNVRVPSSKVVPPVKVLLAVRIRAPAPVLSRPALPAMTQLS